MRVVGGNQEISFPLVLASLTGVSNKNISVFSFFVVVVIHFIKSNLPAVKYLNSCWPGL